MAIVVVSAKVKCLLALAALLAVGALSPDGHLVEAQKGCKVDFQDLVTSCTHYVSKTGPMEPGSAECCKVIKPFDMSCACKIVTKDFEDIISMEKAVFVVRSCGINVPAGLKCGSYTIPPPVKVPNGKIKI